MTYRKNDLIEQVARAMPDVDAKAAVDAVFDGVKTLTAGGDLLVVNGFGTFGQRRRKAHTTRNPRTGDTMHVPATSRLGFKGSKT